MRTIPVIIIDPRNSDRFEVGMADAPSESARFIRIDHTPLDTLIDACDSRCDLVARELGLYDKILGLRVPLGTARLERMDNIFNKPPLKLNLPPAPVEAVPHQLIVALATMLGGGEITLDNFDLENAQRIMDNGDCQISVKQDPPQVRITIKEAS